ncbi:MAG: hypothetical protein JWN78_2071, partial [Bacteroidota bacterium]|nr:hypothetical protein [Bacteroidota bacterium]
MYNFLKFEKLFKMRIVCIALCFFFILVTVEFANGQTLLQDLPNIYDPSVSLLQSTYDRTGLNDDHITPQFHNYYDVIPQGKVNNPGGTSTNKKEYVICNITGPAIVERFWMITFPLNFDARFRFYFDGEISPKINKSFNEFFIAQTIPFVKPLVQNIFESSGGFWSYIKIPVAKSLIVTIDTAAVFCQFGVRQLQRDTVIESWQLAQDNSYLTNEFNKSGTYPKNNLNQTSKDSAILNLLPGQITSVFSKTGNYLIDAIKMSLPLDYTYSTFVKDKGNFHKGTSKFTLNINGNADTVLLIKRSNKFYQLAFDFNSLSENAIIKVDNQLAGSWQNAGYRTYRPWENDTFRIPKNLYQGKSSITVEAQYLSGEPWNEYYYWISCDHMITDSLDVATTASETAHNYSVSNVQTNLYKEINNRYDAPTAVKQKNKQILDSLYVKIFFDDEAQPSVNAPAGLFFATGVNDATYMKSIPCGNVNGEFYNYFSMPFWKNVRIELENRSHQTIINAEINIFSSVNSYEKKETGYLKTYFNKGTKGFSDRTDYLVADITGKGRYVGTVIEADQNSDTSFCWLEGDERIYVDEARTPVFYGTGTEDYFNSTFYFYLDEYSLQQSGMTNSDLYYHKSMYRFHLTDPINFQKNIRFQIEHGDYNNKLGNYQSLAFAYVQPSNYLLTDSIDVGNTISEQQHQYITPNGKIYIDKISAFEGEKYTELLRQDGYSISDSTQFRVNISSQNKGVRLLKTFDYSIKNQAANVFVDDSLVGQWLNAGFNTTSMFREEYFVIPEKYTANKSTLQIKMVNVNVSSRWTELYYKVYSVVDSFVISTGKNSVTALSYKIFPTITKNKVTIQTNDERVTSYVITNSFGDLITNINVDPKSFTTTIDLSHSP